MCIVLIPRPTGQTSRPSRSSGIQRRSFVFRTVQVVSNELEPDIILMAAILWFLLEPFMQACSHFPLVPHFCEAESRLYLIEWLYNPDKNTQTISLHDPRTKPQTWISNIEGVSLPPNQCDLMVQWVCW